MTHRVQRAGMRVEHHIIDGEAAQALAGYADEHGFDLIVCGYDHSRGTGRLLMRGVTDPAHGQHDPLLVVSGEPD